MTEKKTKVAQGTGIAAIVLALAGAVGNYYQAQAVKESSSESTKKVARAVGPEVNLLIKRVDRLEDRLFRLEGRALDYGPPAMLAAPTSMPVPVVDAIPVEPPDIPQDTEAAAIMDEPDTFDAPEAEEEEYEILPDKVEDEPVHKTAQQPIDMGNLLDDL